MSTSGGLGGVLPCTSLVSDVIFEILHNKTSFNWGEIKMMSWNYIFESFYAKKKILRDGGKENKSKSYVYTKKSSVYFISKLSLFYYFCSLKSHSQTLN